ncbi:MAG: hypothetical protein ACRDOG_15080 [Gaiellaceae bacterium]
MLARARLLGSEGARARADAARAVALASAIDDAFSTIVALEVAADILAASRKPVPAVNLRATATRIRSECDAYEGRMEQAWSSETLERALAGLGAAEYDRAWEAGATAGAQDALASAAFEL